MQNKIYLVSLVVLFLILIGGRAVYADATTGLALTIAPNGDIPAVQVACSGTDTSMYIYPSTFFGVVIQRVGCVNGVASFDSFNLSTTLASHVDPSWWNYWPLPTYYAIKNTTGLAPGLSWSSYQGILNLCGDFDGYTCGASYNPTNTEWPTLGAGPAFTSSDNGVTWSNVANGDGSANYATSTNATSTPPTGNSNVLFLPGLEASRLYYQKPGCVLNCEDQLWEPLLASDAPKLYLDNNGKSINNVYTKDVIDTTPKFNVYQSLIFHLKGLVSSGQISEWTPYVYDWRQGIQDIVDKGTPYQATTTSLITTLQTLVNSSKNGKVTIVAHSNGGLLAKALIKKLEDLKTSGQSNLIDHIDNLVMVAVPQIGTADAIDGLLDGYDQSINILGVYNLVSLSQARNLAINMSSAYGLLPSQAYFNQAGIINPASFSSSTPQIFINKYGIDINSYQEEHNFVIGAEGRSAPSDSDTTSPLMGNSSLLAQAETLHNFIDNMTLPVNIKVFDIAGWGKDTVGGMVYGNDTLNPIFTNNGDGTVVQQSALYGTGTKYWLDLTHSTIDHKQIMEDPQVLSFLDNIIENTSSSTTLSTTQPIQIGNRLHLSVHSPVSIGVYDNQSNFTGKTCDDLGNCTIQENIPGSTYLEFGEGKYINLGQGDLQKAVLQGTDIGTFTFDYQTVTPTGQTNTLSFTDIPVTTQTQATITTNPITQTPQLALDVTGDGVTDFTLTPNESFDPITYLQVIKATIDSLDITDAKKKAFDIRVDNIIKSIQKGKVDKAKLKADKFITVLQNRLAKLDPKKPKPKKLSKTDAQTLLDLLNGLLDNLS